MIPKSALFLPNLIQVIIKIASFTFFLAGSLAHAYFICAFWSLISLQVLYFNTIVMNSEDFLLAEISSDLVCKVQNVFRLI